MRTNSKLIVTVSFMLASSTAAFAHARVQTAVPPVDGTVGQPPHEVAIAFTDAVELRFSRVQVTNAAQRVDAGQPLSVNGDAEGSEVDQFTVAAADASGITVEHAWARASAGSTPTGAA